MALPQIQMVHGDATNALKRESQEAGKHIDGHLYKNKKEKRHMSSNELSKPTLVSHDKNWWDTYFSSTKEEQLQMIKPTSTIMAYQAGICDREGWFPDSAKRREEIMLIIESSIGTSSKSGKEVFAEVDTFYDSVKQEFFENAGLSAYWEELSLLRLDADERKKIIDDHVELKESK